MAVTYISSGATSVTNSNPTPATPAHNIGDMLLLVIGTKPDTAPATPPAGWTTLGTASGGTGSTGRSSGPVRVGVFYRIADGTSLDDVGSISIPNNSVSTAQIHVFRMASATSTWDFAGVGAADTTANTTFTAVMPSNPGLTVGDALLAVGITPIAATTYTNETVSATGMTTVTLTEVAELGATASGNNQIGGWVARGTVVTGTSTGNPTISSTASSSTSAAGPLFLVRLREVAVTAKSTTDTASISIADASSTSKATTMQITASDASAVSITDVGAAVNGIPSGGGSSSKNVLLVRNDTAPSANDATIISQLQSHGHTVTDIAANATIPTTGYDVILVSESISSSELAQFSTHPLPVVSFEIAWSSLRLSASNCVLGSAGSWTLSTHEINSAFTSPLNVDTSSTYSVPITDLPSGVEAIATMGTEAHGIAAEAGAILTSGTAPARRVAIGISDGKVSAVTAAGWDYVSAAVVWAGGGAGQTWTFPDVKIASDTPTLSITDTASIVDLAPVSKSTTDTATISIADTSSLSASTFVTKSTTDTAAISITSTASTQTVSPLPGIVEGVEPEAGGGWQGPHRDSNGNLYRVTEEYLNDPLTGTIQPGYGNHPRMMKSADGGATWQRMDAVNGPGYGAGVSSGNSYNDMESAWLVHRPSHHEVVLLYMKAESRWWGVSFRTSDHPTNPDTWDTSTFATSSGQDQFSTQASESAIAGVALSDGTVRAFIRGAPQGGFQAILHRVKTPSGGWDTAQNYITESFDIVRPSAVVANNDITYLFYRDSTNGRVYYRTITAAGVVSPSTRVDTGGAGLGVNYENNIIVPVYYDDNGVPVVVVGFVNASNKLRTVEIRNGVVAAEHEVSTDALTTNPKNSEGSTEDNQASSAALAVAGKTLYAIWSNDADGNIYYATRPNGGSWGTKQLLIDTGTGNFGIWTNAKTYTINNNYVIGYTVDIGPHPDDGSNINYNELYAGSASTTTNVSASDTASVSSSENVARAASSSTSDTGSVSTLENTAIFRASPASDTASVTITESRSLTTSSSASDSAAVATSETTANFVSVTTADVSSIAVGETSPIDNATTATDTGALAITETTSFIRNIAVTDTGTVTIADSASQFATLAVSDTSAANITESTTTFANNNTSDTASASIAEIRSIASTISRTDTASVSVADNSASFTTSTRTDTGAVIIMDVATTTVMVTTTDTSSVTVGENAPIDNSLTATDTASLSITEASGVQSGNFIVGADSASVAVAETASGAITAAAADTSAVSITDSTAAFKGILVSDSVGVSIADVSQTLVRVTATDVSSVSVGETDTGNDYAGASDTVSVAVSETVITSITSPANDTGAIMMSDVSFMVKTIFMATSDVAAIALADASTSANSIVGSDSGTVAVSELRTNTVSVSGIETSSVSVVDSSAGFVTLAANDLASTALVESAVETVTQQASDTAGVAVADTSSVFANVAKAATETTAVTVSEARTLATTSTVSETAGIAMAETGAIFATISSADLASVSIADVGGRFSTLTASDTSSVAVTGEGSAMASNNTFIANDASAMAISDTSSTNGTTLTTENAALVVAETATMVKTIGVTDTAAVNITENRSLGTNLPGQELAAVSVAETRSVQVTVSRAEQAALSISEFRTQAGSVTTTDTTGISMGEQSTKAISASKSATEQAAVVINEATDIGQSQGMPVRVYKNGELVFGIMKVYVNGQFKVAIKRRYVNGVWI